MVLQSSNGPKICNQCILDANNDLHGDADDTIRCLVCNNTKTFVVEYDGDTEVVYEAGPKDAFDRRVYRVVSMQGTFGKLSKFKAMRCTKCEHRIPEWEVENHRYVRLTPIAKDRRGL